MENNNEIAVFGGGCFWCTEAVFLEIKGVKAVASGYSGGHVANPNYYQVCEETTGHAEVVRIEFDPSEISFKEMLEVFFASHDPTTLNYQGADRGARYRSVVLHTTDSQRDEAAEYIKELDAEGSQPGPVVTEISPFEVFYESEPEHRQFYQNNPGSMYCQVVISPKVAKIRQKFAKSLR
jgi:peptide-methionine (S)-S-oxide reductase